MKKYNNIIVPTDGSVNSKRALEHAVVIASSLGATITLVYVANIVSVISNFDQIPNASGYVTEQVALDMEEEGKGILDEFAKSIPQNIEVKSVFEVGSPGPAVLSVAKKYNADLIVMGRRGSHSLSEQILGSASTYVLAHAKCPVLLAHNEKEGPYQRILVPADGSEESLKAVRYAVEFAKADGASVTVFHVANMRDLIAEETALDQKKHGLEDLTDRLRQSADRVFALCKAAVADHKGGVDIHFVANIGRPGPTILKKAEKDGSDLLIMGSRGRSGLTSILLGSVSRYITTHSGLPVMIVK